jgi:hypothetical protein
VEQGGGRLTPRQGLKQLRGREGNGKLRRSNLPHIPHTSRLQLRELAADSVSGDLNGQGRVLSQENGDHCNVLGDRNLRVTHIHLVEASINAMPQKF